MGINGEGVGYFKRQVVFVPGALPGEESRCRSNKSENPKFSEAKIKKIRKKSEHRVQPPCPVYEECGGCQLQHLHYDQQLKEKRDIIIQSLERHYKVKSSASQYKRNDWHGQSMELSEQKPISGSFKRWQGSCRIIRIELTRSY